MDRRYSMKPIEPHMIYLYKGAILTETFFSSDSPFAWPLSPYVRTAMLTHGIESAFHSSWLDKMEMDFLIFAHEKQAIRESPGKVCRPHPLVDELLSGPSHKINQYSYTGPYQLGGWTRFRNCPEILRPEIEKELGTELSPDKPIVAFYDAHNLDEQQYVPGLKALAPHVHLIVKKFFSWDTDPLRGIKIYFWPDHSYAANLLRFGADYLLTGYWGGTFATSAMIGLKVIPYYTENVYLAQRRNEEEKRHYTHFLPTAAKKDDNIGINGKLMRYLAEPLDIRDTPGIMDRVGNQAYWQKYYERLPTTQKMAFGNYQLNDAASITAAMMVRGFETGKLGDYCVAAQVRKPYLQILDGIAGHG